MKKKYTFLVLASCLFLLIGSPLLAADLRGDILNKTKGVANTTFQTDVNPENALAESVGTVVNVLVGVLGAIAVILILYAGFLWMTAGGNDEQIKKAKNTIRATVIGMLIVAFAYGIASFFIGAVAQKEVQKKTKSGTTAQQAPK